MDVVLVGLGALGSNLLLFARELPDIEWRLVDFDRVEHKNTLSQFHPRNTVGRNKVAALQQSMRGLFKLKTLAYPTKLEGDNIEQVFTNADLVIDCVDNAPTRQLITDFCAEHHIDCMHGGLSADGKFGLIRWNEDYTVDEDVGGDTCEDGGFLPFIGLVATAMSVKLQSYMQSGEKRGCNITPSTIHLV